MTEIEFSLNTPSDINTIAVVVDFGTALVRERVKVKKLTFEATHDLNTILKCLWGVGNSNRCLHVFKVLREKSYYMRISPAKTQSNIRDYSDSL